MSSCIRSGPQKLEYLIAAQHRNISLVHLMISMEKKSGIKKVTDNRVIPATQSTINEILMRGFKDAGLGAFRGKKYLNTFFKRDTATIYCQSCGYEYMPR